jgi:agmatine deiminase
MRVVRVPAPARATDAEGAWVHWSYLDHLLVNGGVVAPVFDDVRDGEVIDLLAEVHPGRQVIGVDARPLSGPGRSLCSCAVGQPADRPAAALEPHRAVAGTGPS